MRLYLLPRSYAQAASSDVIMGMGAERASYKAGQGKMLQGSSSGVGFVLESQ